MKPIYLTKTQTGKKELFVPIKEGEVSIYQCGPTVYDYAHIGNLRTNVMYDVTRRMFEVNGYKVKQVMNITDVDDKTIRGAQKEKLPLTEFTQKYEKIFLTDLKHLNVKTPTVVPHATHCISEMISMIEDLLVKEFAYKTEDGIYFSIAKSDGYGALAHLDRRTEAKSRILKDEYTKDNPQDFALWKFWKDEDGDVAWDAPFGKGRPGWHIECSAMSKKELGPTLDIHMGGSDLTFPHHVNEIAQSEAANSAPFVNYWIHGAMMSASDSKMSKSLGNFIRLVDVIEKGIHPLSYRYFLFSARYSTTLNFSWEALAAAQTTYEKVLWDIAVLLKKAYGATGAITTDYTDNFLLAINDDMNFPSALSTLHEVLGSALSPADKLATIKMFDAVLGLQLFENAEKMMAVSPEIVETQKAMEQARAQKDFKKSDELRAQIEMLGYVVREGVLLKSIKLLVKELI